MQIHLTNRVQECHTDRGKEPRIVIQGLWLPEFGFVVDATLLMKIEEEKITISKINPSTSLEN